MTDYASRLAEQRSEVAARMHAIVDAAEAERRDLSAAEDRRLRDLEADHGRLTGDIARLAKLAARPDELTPQMRAVLNGASETRMSNNAPAIRDLFAQALEGGFAAYEYRVDPALYETRALQSAGGSAIATSFADFVTTFQRTLTPMLDPNIVTVLGRSDGSPLVLPRLTADPNHGGTVTLEAAGLNELDSTISSVQLNPYKYGIVNVYSSELATDNTLGLEALLAKSAARELSIDIGAHLTTGNNSGQPNGIVAAAFNGGTAGGTATNTALDVFFGPADIVSLYYNLASPYRAAGSFMVSTDAFAKITKFRDSTGQPILDRGFAGTPDRLLGRPIYENASMAAVGSASHSVIFGDLSQYVVCRVMPLRVEVSRDYKFGTDQLALRTIDRVDGDLIDTAAVAYMVSANT